MAKLSAQGEKVRRYILRNVTKHSSDIIKVTAGHFDISRQAVHKHIQRLVDEGHLHVDKAGTRNATYKLAPILEWRQVYPITADLAEDLIWRDDVKNVLNSMPENVLEIWHYGFTKMFNNAIDHSEGSEISVHLKKTAINTEMLLCDDGLGIFKKIQDKLGLLDERHAILELSKGKLTTDPQRHTGEGIFFTSRMFDSYDIISGGVYFSHKFDEPEDWILERDHFKRGTFVWMKLNNHTARTVNRIFDQYAPGEEYAFNKTIVPVRLAQYGNDKLVSRSQAKRLLARVELFAVVVFDFKGIDSIGQAFADEIFRVFVKQHPDIKVTYVNANQETTRMIKRAKASNIQ